MVTSNKTEIWRKFDVVPKLTSWCNSNKHFAQLLDAKICQPENFVQINFFSAGKEPSMLNFSAPKTVLASHGARDFSSVPSDEQKTSSLVELWTVFVSDDCLLLFTQFLFSTDAFVSDKRKLLFYEWFK